MHDQDFTTLCFAISSPSLCSLEFQMYFKLPHSVQVNISLHSVHQFSNSLTFIGHGPPFSALATLNWLAISATTHTNTPKHKILPNLFFNVFKSSPPFKFSSLLITRLALSLFRITHPACHKTVCFNISHKPRKQKDLKQTHRYNTNKSQKESG